MVLHTGLQARGVHHVTAPDRLDLYGASGDDILVQVIGGLSLSVEGEEVLVLLQLEHGIGRDASKVLTPRAQHGTLLAGEALHTIIVVHAMGLHKGAHNPASGRLQEAVAVAVVVRVKGGLQGWVRCRDRHLGLAISISLGLICPHLLVLLAPPKLHLAVLVRQLCQLFHRLDLPLIFRGLPWGLGLDDIGQQVGQRGDLLAASLGHLGSRALDLEDLLTVAQQLGGQHI
mmetsp:Transcript_21143/g.58672  ORF Transcript_21143/g.58672 Transcript_21143/m.58672 type:complete len:230 (+) Transcript_21143:626-1315(+)